MLRRFSRALLVALSLVATSAPLLAQTAVYTHIGFQDLPPPPAKPSPPPAPNLSLRLDAEIPLPGPLPGTPPRLLDDAVEIPVAGGTMLATPEPGAEPRWIAPSETPGEDDPTRWVEDAAGKTRYRAVPGGRIEAQRRCGRCKSGWKRRWRLRVAGNTLAPPLVVGQRLYFGALDNRVYCVKTRNGHRVWVADVRGRVSSPLVAWSGTPDGAGSEEMLLILAVPDGGGEMLALEGHEGQPLASVRLPEGSGKLVGAPLTTPGGAIVVARQDYAEGSAALLVYGVEELPDEPAAEEKPTDAPDASSEISLNAR